MALTNLSSSFGLSPIQTNPILNSSSNGPIYGLTNFKAPDSSAQISFENYFSRVDEKYKDVKTEAIQKIALKSLENAEFKNFVVKNSYQNNNFFSRIFGVKNSLGEVLTELQNSQESPNRKLLPKKVIKNAEKESDNLLKKYAKLVQKKTDSVSKINSEFTIAATSIAENKKVVSLGNKFFLNWDSHSSQSQTPYNILGRMLTEDGSFDGGTTSIFSSQYIQTAPFGAKLTNGEIVVAWESKRSITGNIDIYVQKLFQNGTKDGSDILVNSYQTNDQMRPLVTPFSNGDFFVIWKKDRDNHGKSNISGQLFNIDGSKNGTERAIAAGYSPSIATLNNDRFVVVYGIHAQIYNSDGSKIGTEFLVVDNVSESTSISTAVASLSNGNFNIVLRDSGKNLYSQMFDQDGNRIGSKIQVASDASYPEIFNLNDEGFIVAWSAQKQSSKDCIFAQKLHSDGTVNGDVFQASSEKINDDPTIDNLISLSTYVPSGAKLQNNKFVLAWHYYWQYAGRFGIVSDYGIKGQVFSTDVISYAKKFFNHFLF